jgi:hypothetical protein
MGVADIREYTICAIFVVLDNASTELVRRTFETESQVWSICGSGKLDG